MICCKWTTISILLTSFIVSKHVMHLHKIFLSNYNDIMIETIFYFQKHFKLYIKKKKKKKKVSKGRSKRKQDFLRSYFH